MTLHEHNEIWEQLQKCRSSHTNCLRGESIYHQTMHSDNGWQWIYEFLFTVINPIDLFFPPNRHERCQMPEVSGQTHRWNVSTGWDLKIELFTPVDQSLVLSGDRDKQNMVQLSRWSSVSNRVYKTRHCINHMMCIRIYNNVLYIMIIMIIGIGFTMHCPSMNQSYFS